MIKKFFVAALLAVVLLCAFATTAKAEEICPGCYGKGRIGCGRCLSTAMGAFIGKCHTCCGFYAQSFKAGERCPTCRGSQVCQGCDGKGMACLVCKGSGRVPNGFAKAVAEDRAKKQAAGIDKHVKQGLKLLVGRWKGEGESAEQGKFKNEMRWTSVLDGSYLRHEERITYASGAVAEYVSYLTWNESDQNYVWIVFFAPGRGLRIRGVPGEGDRIDWEMVLDNGSILKMRWSIKAAEKRIDFENWMVAPGEEPKSIGTTSCARSGDAGSALVTATSHKPDDEATTACLEGLKPISSLVGRWTGTGESARGKVTSENKWSATLGGTVYETDSRSTYADGTKLHSLGAVIVDPGQKKLFYVLLSEQGAVSVFNGEIEAGDEGAKVTIDVNGAHVVWKFSADGKKLEWFADVASGEDGTERKVVEKGVDTKE